MHVLASGNADEIAKYGPQDMTTEEIALHNSDAIEHADYVEKRKYADDRAAEYPTITDQIGALWMAVEQLSKTGNLPTESAEMLEEINTIKAKYPKPGAE